MNTEKLILFEGKKIRKILHNEEWYFSVIDVIFALTNSDNPRNYWNMLKSREFQNGIQLSTNCVQLKLESSDGKFYSTDCANKENFMKTLKFSNFLFEGKQSLHEIYQKENKENFIPTQKFSNFLFEGKQSLHEIYQKESKEGIFRIIQSIPSKNSNNIIVNNEKIIKEVTE